MKIEREEFEKERNYLNKTVSLIRKKKREQLKK